MQECAICNLYVADEVEALTCKGCAATYHRECRIGTGRCVTEGCKRNRGEHPDAIRNRSQDSDPMSSDVSGLLDSKGGRKILIYLVLLGVGGGILLAKLLGFELPG